MKSDEGGGTAYHTSTSLFATVSQSQMGGGGGGVDVNKDAPKSSACIPAARWPPPGSLVQTGAGPICVPSPCWSGPAGQKLLRWGGLGSSTDSV